MPWVSCDEDGKDAYNKRSDMSRTCVRCLKTLSVVTLVIAVMGLTGCSVTRSRTSDYLAGFSTAPAGPPRKAPIPAAVVLAIPETEAAKPMALTPVIQKELVELVRTNLRDTKLAISSIAPPIVLAGDGKGALTPERLRQISKETGMQHLLVLILSSQSVQRVQEYPIIETELFARVDAALVDLTANRILLTAAGEEDYILGQRRDVARTIGYPRIYYRTQTTTGPFTVVEGDPFSELGKIAFTAATDQLLLALQADE
jgi:hypothetical protein